MHWIINEPACSVQQKSVTNARTAGRVAFTWADSVDVISIRRETAEDDAKPAVCIAFTVVEIHAVPRGVLHSGYCHVQQSQRH